MIIVDKETFEAEVQQSSMPCVVDLWGPQCGPCLALMPEVEKLAEAYEGKLKFCKLNVAENRRLVISLRVMAVPTILFYKGGDAWLGFPATPCPSKPSRPKRTNSSNVCGQRAVMVCSILTQP